MAITALMATEAISLNWHEWFRKWREGWILDRIGNFVLFNCIFFMLSAYWLLDETVGFFSSDQLAF